LSKPIIITFYLPQYHTIPENDEWWGKGFTDWRNVAKSKPRFLGHYQPHIPSDLGYYDLRLEETRIAQAKLARQYGISGFCYYHYWFNEKMLLERPFNEVLKSGKPDFPFCLCWANENWTRRWDGQDKEILIKQNYEKYDQRKHIEWLNKAFSDNRYIKINGKPLFLIYNAAHIPDLKMKVTEWRRLVKEKGHPDIYLCSVKSIHNNLSDSEIMNLGFNAIVDFTPNGRDKHPMKVMNIPQNFFRRAINKLILLSGLKNKISKLAVSYVYSYKSLVDKKIETPINGNKTFPCVMPSWDNSARSKMPFIMQNNDPDLYKIWLEKSIEKVGHFSDEEQIVFINAWNEWAEGCHLEPDLRNGKIFLEATLQVVKQISASGKN